MARHALIAGGSIGGLFAAAALQKAGWTVDVFERTEVELAGRGAGIVTHDTLIDALRHVGADLTDLGVQVAERTAFDKAGGVVTVLPHPQIVTSWDRMHRILRRLIPDDRHHLGRAVTGYAQDADGVVAQFSDGSTVRGDLLVGADGFRSAIRAQMLPDVQPTYAGYVVWRALAQERDLPADVAARVFPTFAFFAPSGTQIIGYPIAGRDNDLSLGNRRYNFVWYAPADADALRDMLTDAAGHQHAISIPPPLVRDDVLDAMQANARRILPPDFTAILDVSERPFFTPIYDHHSPVMHDGRVVLLGDAACVARPHVGMGVTKAAEDALALAVHADDPAAYSAIRVPASERAYLRARKLGSWIFQDDPANADGAHNARLRDIMRLTAVTED
ncbi:2-polyprenyl-6-methoxyphenol hydroxylase [Loktanella fryxellensis]|uniref:2-polyprenyl-6-methoxyphenol hydroxylase n=1 Tax=Loktanella fryxellensis TaxID=245187 RepID=A0A1H8C4X1_9RHOB|nr:FAD-dependent monooxygenase [Loktanella fryxellensis]SEM89504.1 2-polyprenyl-6-methoxyphenol hydroxylase [Loktanella fryxellensis]